MKLGRLWLPVALHNLRRPRGLVGAAVSILRSGPTRWMLERLREQDVPVVAIHGDRDIAVPLRTGEDAARRAGGELVVVHGATHAWPLKDPETLPAIVGELLAEGSLGDAIRRAIKEAGLDPDGASLSEVEAAMCAPDARILGLVAGPGSELAPDGLRDRPRRPRYTWTRTRPLPTG
ncbi:MAG: alpha/beta hydrolase [Acidimicrobiia bacterium]|nr:alpha/beta hydrolase [Acidimicrobiia bacterium]